jgi:hypothetical protein
VLVDRLSGFMIRPGPHRPADRLTVRLVAFDALAVAGVWRPCPGLSPRRTPRRAARAGQLRVTRDLRARSRGPLTIMNGTWRADDKAVMLLAAARPVRILTVV